MHHQDWETIILNKPTSSTVAKTTPPATLTASQKPAWKVEKQVDADTGKPLTYVDPSTAKSIVSGRVARKLSQKDLARRLNVSEKEIKDIESGKALENKALLSKIRRELGI